MMNLPKLPAHEFLALEDANYFAGYLNCPVVANKLLSSS